MLTSEFSYLVKIILEMTMSLEFLCYIILDLFSLATSIIELIIKDLQNVTVKNMILANCFVGSQFGVVVIRLASATRDRVRTWAEICRSQSNAEGFSPGTPVFVPPSANSTFRPSSD